MGGRGEEVLEATCLALAAVGGGTPGGPPVGYEGAWSCACACCGMGEGTVCAAAAVDVLTGSDVPFV